MNFKTLLFSIVFISLISVQAYSQRSFFDGYVVTNYGDTIYGRVKDRKPEPFGKLYKKIRFKPNKGFRKRLGPQQIQAYKIGDLRFISMGISDEIVLFKRIVKEIPNSNNKQFIKVISEHYLSWYEREYMDDSGLSSVYYFKRSDEYDMAFVRTGLFGLNKKRLSEYFYDCPELAEQILDKRIKRPEDIFRFYNDWYSNQ